MTDESLFEENVLLQASKLVPLVVFFHPEKANPPMNARANLNLDQITLHPGSNSFDPETFDKLESHPDFPRLAQEGVITTDPAHLEVEPTTQVTNLSAYTPSEANEIIEHTFDYGILVSWHQLETRSEVKQTLENRMIKVREAILEQLKKNAPPPPIPNPK
jgi:hypothetical protein